MSVRAGCAPSVSRTAMDTAGLLLILGLAALLPTDAAPCGAQRPDNSTASKVGETPAPGLPHACNQLQGALISLAVPWDRGKPHRVPTAPPSTPATVLSVKYLRQTGNVCCPEHLNYPVCSGSQQ